MRSVLFSAAMSISIFAQAGLAQGEPALDRAQLLEDLRMLAADEMQGREAGSPGGALARAYIIERLEEIGVPPIGESYEHSFTFTTREDPEKTVTGFNIVGRIEGVSDSDRAMVVTAHYDHEGMRGDEIWNGADDNASGVAGVLAIAADFIANPPEHDVILALLDAEEKGLQGARTFVAEPPVPQETIAFNLNLDMIAMSEEGILWAVGTYHYPFLVPLVEEVAARAGVSMPMGFDEPSEDPSADWTYATDSGAFHRAGIPFIYLGVDYHPHYHQPSDTYENMTLDFFQDASAAVVDFAREADERLDAIGEAAGR
ncbi:M20/M25/M40 family metallo-hydrolase [Maricaulis sp.]|uniref:M20/M25/M40 family metallo-hydrolase n=1 Tax=Maricaulis sp. TaxID=1486257 RepID=UPI002610D0C7|nr:M20/M25/M40 family metallo-hydrolase [Maricaulis sp.]